MQSSVSLFPPFILSNVYVLYLYPVTGLIPSCMDSLSRYQPFLTIGSCHVGQRLITLVSGFGIGRFRELLYEDSFSRFSVLGDLVM